MGDGLGDQPGDGGGVYQRRKETRCGFNSTFEILHLLSGAWYQPYINILYLH